MNNEEIEENRKKAAEKPSESHTKTWWRDQCRMKPIDLNVYDREYKNDYGTYCRLYIFEQCKPMHVTSQKRSEAQKKATQKMVLTNQLNELKRELRRSDKPLAIRTAQKMIEDDVIVLDTETTGLNRPYIVDIAAISSRTGETIVNTKVFTRHSIESGAEAVHGISNSDLEGAPDFNEVFSIIKKNLKGRNVTAFNSSFDSRAMRCTAKDAGLLPEDQKLIEAELFTGCLMDLAADFYGATNWYGSISLEDAMWDAGCQWDGEAHKAITDTRAALSVLKSIAESTFISDMEKKIADLEERIRKL
ncbi:exonuclease domain-containing protein [Oceanihabitans sediminis]|uniref:3'-5' exonuclease n=1 Tax=Oceanihabitans sediminis TaxID=1812012 RepID=UPI003A9378B2